MAPGEAYVLAPNAVFQIRQEGGQLALRSSLELDSWTAAFAPREVRDLALAPAGDAGVVASSNDIAVVLRDPVSGALELLTGTSIRLAQALRDLEISPDGRFVYVLCSQGTFVYELRRDPAALGLVQFFPETGSALRLSGNGIDVLLLKSGGTPFYASRSAATGSLAPALLDTPGPLPFDVRDAFFGAGGSLLYLIHGPLGAPNPIGRIEVLARQPDGSWSPISDATTADRPAREADPRSLPAATFTSWTTRA